MSMVFNMVSGGGGASARILCTAPEGCTVTASKGSEVVPMTWKEVQTNYYYVGEVKEYGDWTVTAEKDGEAVSENVVVDVATDFYVSLSFRSYTVESGITAYSFAIGSVVNPDAELYDGVWQSNNQGRDATYAVAKITFKGYSEFNVYIRSYAESNYDYTIASGLDASSYPTSFSSAGVVAHTRGNQKAGATINDYTKASYQTDGGEHHIYIVYCKDGSASSGSDTGWFLIER